MALVAAAALFGIWQWAAHSPDYAILRRKPPARWIRLPEPANPNARPVFPRIATFRRSFTVSPNGGKVIVYVAALRRCRLSLNNHQILPADHKAPWYKGQKVDLTPYLVQGRNDLEAVVENATGPPVFLLAGGGRVPLSTPAGWSVSKDGQNWFSPEMATDGKPFPVAMAYPTAWQGLRNRWLLFLELAVLALCVLLLEDLRRRGGEPGPGQWITPARFRWLLLGLYVLLCAHNLPRLPAGIGFDAPAHYSYINYLLSRHKLPLATDGWQMFEPPLFYGLGALVQALGGLVLSAGKAAGLVRLVPMACGAGMIELCYRTGRLLFPGRATVQRIATAVGGFLPMNIYVSQYVGNEPLAGFLSALALYIGLRMLCRDRAAPFAGESVLLGSVLGLALLAKVTAALLVVPLGALLYWVARKKGESRGKSAWQVAWMLTFCGALSGWYYMRNWILLGRPFIGGWEARSGMAWWQDPGYRWAGDLLGFGHALVRPVYAAAYGFWDGLYSSLWLDGYLGSATSKPAGPFWRPDLLAAAAMLAVPLVVLVAWGMVRAMRPGTDPAPSALRFLLTCGIIYLSAMIALYISSPIYAAVKATYALALVPALGAVAAYGAESLLKRPILKTLFIAYLFCWVGAVYCTYWAG